MIGEGEVKYWIVKPFQYVWVIHLYVGFEVSDGCGEGEFYDDFGMR